MKLPSSVREIADVIGDERALFLIGKLPKCYPKDARYPNAKREKVMLYVPRTLKPDHPFVRIIGWRDAEKLAGVFGGEILNVANCAEIYRPFRDAAIVRLAGEGVPVSMLAEWFDVCDRHIRNLVKENPQVGLRGANDNNTRDTKIHKRR